MLICFGSSRFVWKIGGRIAFLNLITCQELLLKNPEAIKNLFFLKLALDRALIPLIIAALATVFAGCIWRLLIDLRQRRQVRCALLHPKWVRAVYICL